VILKHLLLYMMKVSTNDEGMQRLSQVEAEEVLQRPRYHSLGRGTNTN